MTLIALHIDLLGRLHLVAGWLALLVSISLASLGFGAFGIRGEGAPDVATSLAAAVFFGLSVTFALWAAAMAIIGWSLRDRRPWARLAAMALGVVNLFVIPFGTALSIYAAWVLLQDAAKADFGAVDEPVS